MKKVIVFIIVFSMLLLNFYSASNDLYSVVCDVYLKDEIIKQYDDNTFIIASNNYETFLHNCNAKIINNFYIEDRLIIECYTSRIKEYIVVNGRKINIQLSINDGEILIGSPLIKNSF